MLLPSDVAGRITTNVGYFETDASRVAGWLAKIADRSIRTLPPMRLSDLVKEIPPTTELRDFARRDLVIPLGGWCALLNNSVRGTDLGPLPWKAPMRLSCRGVRAVATAAPPHPATMLDVHAPDSEHPLHKRRGLYAESNDGRWSFGSSGEPFDFEEVERYSERRIRDRFTPEMLERYLIALGIPLLRSVEELIEGVIVVATPDLEPGWTRPEDPPERISDEVITATRPSGTAPADFGPLARLLSVAEFFEGNENPESIGWNLPDPPSPQEFHRLLAGIAARPEVADIRIVVDDFDPGTQPITEMIWIVTSADVNIVRSWFPERLAPDDWLTPHDITGRVEPYDPPLGTHVICAWYD